MKNIYDILERDIVFFDLETTGLDLKEDRIVEICAVKYTKGKSKKSIQQYFNPTIPVSEGAFKKNNLTNEYLSQFPTFEESVDEIFNFFKDCDLGGYNSINFDIHILFEEFRRYGKNLNIFQVNLIDSLTLLRTFEPRGLNDTYKKLFNKDIENPHEATSDIEATIEIFEKQIDLYNLKGKSISEISNIIKDDTLDISGYFKRINNEFYFNKGKHKDKLVKDKEFYLDWLMKDYRTNTDTKVVGKIIKNKINE